MPDVAPGTPTPTLDRRLSTVARRLRAARALEAGARAALTLAPVTPTLALVRALVPGSPLAALELERVAILGVAPAAVAFLGATAVALLARPVTRRQAAASIESRLALGVPFTTALELAPEHAWSGLVTLEAERAASAVLPSEVAPLLLPRALARATTVLALGLALLALPPREATGPSREDARVPLPPAAQDALARAGTRVRLSTGSLPAGPSRRRIEEAGEKLQDLAAQVESGKVGLRDALDRLAAASDAVRLEREAAAGRRAARHALERSGALDPLAGAASGRGAPDDRAVRSLATALTRDARARDAARAALREARQSLAQDAPTADALDRAARALDGARPGESPPADLAPALDAAARALAATPGPERDEQAGSELARAAAELDRARESLAAKEPGAGVAGKDGVPSPGPTQVALADKRLETAATPSPGSPTPSQGSPTPFQGSTTGASASPVPPRGSTTPPQGSTTPTSASPAPSRGSTTPTSASPAPSQGSTTPTSASPAPTQASPAPTQASPAPTQAATSPSPPPASDTPGPPKDSPGKPDAPQLPIEAAAELAKLVPPDVLAQALKLAAKLKNQLPTPDASASPPPVSPEQAEKLLSSLPPATLKKLAEAMKDVAKDLPPPPTGSQGKPPIDPETAERLARKLPPDVLESLAQASREARGSAPPPESSPSPSTAQSGAPREGTSPGAPTGARRLDTPGEGTGDATADATTDPTAKGNDPTSGPAPTGSPRGPGGFEGRDTSGKPGTRPGAGTGSPGTGTAATGAPSSGAPAGTTTTASPRTDAPTTGGNPATPPVVSAPGARDGDVAATGGPRLAKVAWGTAPEKLPADAREALRAALELKRVPPSYDRAVREYFDLEKSAATQGNDRGR